LLVKHEYIKKKMSLVENWAAAEWLEDFDKNRPGSVSNLSYSDGALSALATMWHTKDVGHVLHRMGQSRCINCMENKV
jgi:hypothetical protein